MKRKNNKRHQPKRPASKTGIITAVIGTASIVVLAALIIISYNSGGNLGRTASGIGMLFMAADLVAVFYAFKPLRDMEYSNLSRYMGFFAPLAGLALYAALYAAGLVMN